MISFKWQRLFQNRIPSYHSLPSKTLSVVHIFNPLSLSADQTINAINVMNTHTHTQFFSSIFAGLHTSYTGVVIWNYMSMWKWLKIIGRKHDPTKTKYDKCLEAHSFWHINVMTMNSNALEIHDLSKWQPDQCLLYLHNLWSPFLAMDLSASKKNHVPHCPPFKNPSVNRRKSHGSGCQWLLYSIPPMVKALPPQIGSCSAKESLKLWLQSKKTSQNLEHFQVQASIWKYQKMSPKGKVLLLCSMILRPLLPWFGATPLLALACYVLHTHQSAK